MEITSLSPVSNNGTHPISNHSSANNTENSQKSGFGPDYRISISAKLKVTEVQVSYAQSNSKDAEDTEKVNSQNAPPAGQRLKTIGDTREEIRKQIKEQTINLLSSLLVDHPEVKDSLGQFIKENPDAAEEISNGEIPDYFNVDNTSKRILDIYFSRYDGGDKQAFVERAKEIINQAYSDVEGEVGSLPSIVNQTHDRIMDILDKFAAGEDVSEYVKYSEPPVENGP